MTLENINCAEIILTKEERDTLQKASAILDEIATASDERFKKWDLCDENLATLHDFCLDGASWSIKQLAEGNLLVVQYNNRF